ncbi:hypothetical protein [Lacisediminimonas profundi]|uniref:hypothetical protein n=1 Tax=Lacisediminimonas profundi TaxID=2603856 RepID=UPI00124BB2B8|nr:hypothetical protein [Lacisediminimonas profundi]
MAGPAPEVLGACGLVLAVVVLAVVDVPTGRYGLAVVVVVVVVVAVVSGMVRVLESVVLVIGIPLEVE